MSYVSALQVDGDRDNPAALSSKRSTDPVKRAGDWFKRALGATAANAVVSKGAAPANAVEIAQISSRPISDWISYMLQVSDNALAESLARLVSLDQGFDGSPATFTNAFRSALATAQLDLSGVKIEDGSGLSRYNQVSPKLFNDLLTLVAKNQANLGEIRKGLPVAGSSGSLSGRFGELVGLVEAKTGWIRTGYTLSGYLKAEDESTLIFTAYNLGDSVSEANRDALDRLVAGFQACGLALANR
jgi:D-alanyl-D-alanine carboxypeptidase/D-alanyl-D-alanine-endopeptidase (penicillin-binding protein 4)